MSCKNGTTAGTDKRLRHNGFHQNRKSSGGGRFKDKERIASSYPNRAPFRDEGLLEKPMVARWERSLKMRRKLAESCRR